MSTLGCYIDLNTVCFPSNLVKLLKQWHKKKGIESQMIETKKHFHLLFSSPFVWIKILQIMSKPIVTQSNHIKKEGDLEGSAAFTSFQ